MDPASGSTRSGLLPPGDDGSVRIGQVWIGSGFGITWVRKVLRAYVHGEDKNSAINTWRDYGGR